MIHERELAFAKLNLTLDILCKRADGYHDLKMIMQSISLCDQIEVTTGTDGIIATSNLSFLPAGDTNLAVMAARHFYQALGKPVPSLHIHIEKNIPVCAGLAGGSSDAAAVLRLLNRSEGHPFTLEQLAKIGATFGSDIPYCVGAGTALAEGRGEILSPLSSLPHCHLVVCKPDFPLSTPELFGRINCAKIRRRPDTTGMISALDSGNLHDVAHRLYNVFEDALTERHSVVVQDIKNILIQEGALGATMSGSGPTVFGLFSDKQLADQAYTTLLEIHQETFLTEVV